MPPLCASDRNRPGGKRAVPSAPAPGFRSRMVRVSHGRSAGEAHGALEHCSQKGGRAPKRKTTPAFALCPRPDRTFGRPGGDAGICPTPVIAPRGSRSDGGSSPIAARARSVADSLGQPPFLPELFPFAAKMRGSRLAAESGGRGLASPASPRHAPSLFEERKEWPST